MDVEGRHGPPETPVSSGHRARRLSLLSASSAVAEETPRKTHRRALRGSPSFTFEATGKAPPATSPAAEADTEQAALSRKRSVPSFPRHRLAGKTPKGLAGRVAELVCARTVDTLGGSLPGAALAECILQVTGPPTVARSAARARHLLTWLRTHARRGSARVCGRPIAPNDVKEAAKLVGNIWSRKLVRAERRAKAKKQKRLAVGTLVGKPVTTKVAAIATKQKERERDPDADGSSSGESDSGDSDLSDEEDVDSETGDSQDEFDDAASLASKKQSLDDCYRGDWTGAPPLGSPSFNAFAVAVMQKAGIAATFPKGPLEASVCPPLQPHQEAAIFLLHPRSPVQRLLVDHPTGSGKTREMLGVLDNFFHDPRPKVPVFPKEPVCRNFYIELLKWPTQYRDYFCCLRPHCAARASNCSDWKARRTHLWKLSTLSEKELRSICKEVREVLEMKGCFYMGRMRRSWSEDFKSRFPNEPLPAAPLRALRYTSAGGKHAALREDGLPTSALFKVGFRREDPNVYSNKIVIMDEVHNLVRSQTHFAEQLTHLRTLLVDAQGAVLVGFTGTPILSEPHEGRQLLDIIKGLRAPAGDSGFISSFPMRPPSLFPRSLPEGIPDAVLTPKLRRQFVKKVVLGGEALQRYDKKRAAGLPGRRLQRYCNLSVHFGAMHEGKSGSKARVLEALESCAPKLHAIAKDVIAETSKAVVLIARSSGMDVLLDHLKKLAAEANGGTRFGVATMDELASFNSAANRHGELYRVLVADSTQCGEGVSFFTVRRVLIADVPASPSALVQAVGRSIRMYGHSGLPAAEWTVTTSLYISVLPRWLRSPLGAWAYRAQRHHLDPQVAQSKARKLLRKLIKVGIPTLQALKDRLLAHLPQGQPAGAEAPESHFGIAQPQEAEPRNLAFPTPSQQQALPRLEDPESQAADSSISQNGPEAYLSSQQTMEDASQDVSLAGYQQQAADEGASQQPEADLQSRKMKDADIVSFLESIGFWDEAKLMDTRQKLVKKTTKEFPTPGAAKPGRSAGGAQPQHYLARAVQWLFEADSAHQLATKANLSANTADEEALRNLVVSSRALVPALKELRSEAVDREVLQRLTEEVERQTREALMPNAEGESEGESSACDFGFSGASSAEEDTGPLPLVLPPDWQMQKVKRGKGTVREYVDPTGVRYRTEAQARRAVDALRRSANVASRLRLRFEGRFAAAAARGAQPAAGAS